MPQSIQQTEKREKQRSNESNNTNVKEDVYEEPHFIYKLGYDLTFWILSLVFDCFFREIRTRGAFRIPKKGALIFVAAPHANQFVDPGILSNQVKKESNRRVSFLIAAKSLSIPGIRQLAKLAMSIPVKRAQDYLKSATGKIQLDPENPLKIIGHGTEFTKEASVKGLIGLPNSQGNSEISKILSDTEILIKKEFKPKAAVTLQDPVSFKLADKIDQKDVYEKVFAHLSHGQSLGIFPEGGSHDRTDLLPLKAGVAIMALGALQHNPDCELKIVPCGMNYFHPHKFRSRAVVEFGHPISISKELVDKYSDPATSKQAVSQLLNTVEHGLRAVTVTCPDYESLMVVQFARRLYSRDKKLPIPLVVEMNRRLVAGITHYKDDPEIISLREKILNYNQQLKDLYIPDHDVESAQIRFWTNLGILIYRALKLVTLIILALPGGLLFTPVFIVGKWYSQKKAVAALKASVVKIKANDVVATWKILIGMGLAPLLYTFYSILGLYYFRNSNFNKFLLFWIIYIAGAIVTYAALVFGDTGVDIAKSIRPLYITFFKPEILLDLKKTRKQLGEEVIELVNKLGPQLFPDFDHLREENFDEAAEEARTKELKRRRRQRRQREIQEKIESEQSSTSDSETFSNASIFGSSDSESEYGSETSVEIHGDGHYSTGASTKIIDALRERRNFEGDEEN